MNKLSFFLIILALLCICPFKTTAQIKVVYPNINLDGKNLFGYSALKLALENSGKEFTLSIKEINTNNSRIRMMLKNKEISVADFGTSPEFERDFLPVFFPIDLGLNGWRIFIIHKDDQTVFDKITSLEDLKKMTAGQGMGWSDIEILEHSGLKVEKAPNIDNLFKMLEMKRFDYLPLGANETHFLLDTYKTKTPNILVEESILLLYPFGRLFFVHKDNKELHDAIQSGLEESFSNGSFQKLFRTHKSNKALFEKANLGKRKQVFIDNPNMSEKFKKIPPKYFFNLNMLNQ